MEALPSFRSAPLAGACCSSSKQQFFAGRAAPSLVACSSWSSARERRTAVSIEAKERKTDMLPGTSEPSLPKLDDDDNPKSDLFIRTQKAVTKTAATFAPRASAPSKNPAFPGSTLYRVFEAQAYISMAVGGLLSYNLLFPSDQADIWRLMGMWSVWMFTIPSLRARDCSKMEKEALNYLFVLIPLINVTLPIFWKSFAAVWSADVVAFFAMYAWKMEWISDVKKADD